MLINERCTVCDDAIDPADTVECDTCGRPVHDQCADYEMTFECSGCADEPAIGALEF